MRISYKYKLILSFLTIELIFLTFIILYNYHSVHKFTKEIVEQDITSSIKLFKKLIKTPVMIYDLATLDDIVNEFGKLPNVDEVKIYDSKGRLLSKYIADVHKDEKFDKYHKEVNFSIFEDNSRIADVKIIFDLNEVYCKIVQNRNDIIKIALIEIFFSFFTSFFLGRILSQNLIKLSEAIKKVKLDKKIYLDIHSKDEFEDISNAFNQMQEQLNEEIKKNQEKEVQLITQNRNAAMGEMLRAIIHQWKQPLNVISVVNSSVKFSLENGLNIDNKSLMQDCDKIEEEINYMNQTIEDFRNFFKPQPSKIYNINDSIKKVYRLLSKIYNSKGIEIELNLKDNLLTEGYSNELEQVIINILNNAKDAIVENEAKIKKIIINSYQKENNIAISIIDFAGGIDEKIIEKIFDPYFTTKSSDKGTGIGLDMSKKIIEKVNGKILVSNIINKIGDTQYKGAKFEILLPKHS